MRYASRPRHDIPTLRVSGDEGDKAESIFIVPAVAGEVILTVLVFHVPH